MTREEYRDQFRSKLLDIGLRLRKLELDRQHLHRERERCWRNYVALGKNVDRPRLTLSHAELDQPTVELFV